MVSARVSRRSGSVTPRIPQEFNSGGQLFAGGLEAAHEVLEGDNTAGVDVVFDCRSDTQQGRGGTVSIF